MVPRRKTPILNWFYHLLWFYFLTVSEFSCLAKSYSVSGQTPLPHIPNQLHFIGQSPCCLPSPAPRSRGRHPAPPARCPPPPGSHAGRLVAAAAAAA